MSSSKNLDHAKTSFLHKANTSFIEEMYVKFIEGDTTIPQSWKSYFEDLGEDLNWLSNVHLFYMLLLELLL